ncbi:MAG: hypothetical protein A2126_03945 [Candidatus Woykebacteria bacterium GWB1_45_5]|uniref:Uncharacterized protein n=1 Tax=Candidatus Woykebacteria bacterium GWB1_45_5 TaxID=1802592 RepID=A0A1G1W3P3_9BACT|nr:MAG: hypothetical protein A2126_03945 [Candidatus Woykebacteria bacterium GWB1_45_5]
MSSNNQTNRRIVESLEDLISVCKELNCQFRIFGSLIYAAMKEEFYREIGDVDCFIEIRLRKNIIEEFEKRGYARSTKKDEDIPAHLHLLGFNAENFIKENAKISLLYADFKENFIDVPLKFGLSYRIPYSLINRNYELAGKEFKSLTPEAALCALPFVRDEVKKRTDLNILLPFCNQGILREIKNTDTFFWFGKRIPFVSAILAAKIDKFLT